ncbi:hypothetical protein [Streptomyces sp. CB02959]|uniref:hypothetical protein n=1 Tax=Streptomyces sp. CB02959 TaxID=2020330 RepID=UPI00215251A4|nr:hypothetical protein [Streptomyces sp. CB02959]
MINKQTANTTGRASNHWMSAALRGQGAALKRLRVDRQLEEGMVKGPTPLHLAKVFGLDEKTAMRYANSVRALLEQAIETAPATPPPGRRPPDTGALHLRAPVESRLIVNGLETMRCTGK